MVAVIVSLLALVGIVWTFRGERFNTNTTEENEASARDAVNFKKE